MSRLSDLQVRKTGSLWIVSGPERPHRPWLRAHGWRWDGQDKEWWTNREELANELATLIKPDYAELPPALAETPEEAWLTQHLS